MNESYVEWMVKRKPSTLWKFLKILMITATVMFGLVAFVSSNLLVVLAAVALGVGAYFVSLNSEIEYEYLYVNKELSVDKILSQSKRKRVATYDLDKMEIVAPLKSWHLDNYKNRQDKTVDYSSGIEEKPEKRYVFFYDGKEKVIFEPNEAMINAMKQVTARKVYTD